MRGIVHRGKVLKIKMGIDLGGGEVSMPQQLLHAAQIAARLQHMGGKGVAQLVRVYMAVQPLLNAPLGESLLYVACRLVRGEG